MILLLFVWVTISLGLLVFYEFQLDAKILKHPENYHPLFVKYKHWAYNAPRLICWAVTCLVFFVQYKFWPAVGISVLTAVANFFLFRFWHDWLYQWLIITRYKKAIYYGLLNSFVVAFHRDSETPVKEENSFWDKHLRDTSANRLFCFQIFTILTIIQIIFKLY